MGKDHPQFNQLFERLQAKRSQLKKAVKNKPSNAAKMDDETVKALQSLGYLEKASE
jgi:Holliday junction resolvasome RuvABC DNA-binding subunit